MQYALYKYINTAVKLRLVATDGEMRRSMEHGGAHCRTPANLRSSVLALKTLAPAQKLTYNHYVNGISCERVQLVLTQLGIPTSAIGNGTKFEVNEHSPYESYARIY